MFQHKIKEKDKKWFKQQQKKCEFVRTKEAKKLPPLPLHRNIEWQCNLLNENYIQILNVILEWKAIFG